MSDAKKVRKSRGYSIARRQFLIGAGAASLAVSAGSFRRAFAKESITVADPGGPFGPAFDAAFMKPYEQETGDEIVHVARIH